MTALDSAVFAARLLLVAIFLLAGISKLIDREGSRQALIGFGVPEGLARWMDVTLPIAECSVAASLFIGATAWAGSIGALFLLTLFVIGIGVNLVRGRRPNCHCFGQIHSTPVGWPVLTRNVILGAVAGLAVFYGRGAVNPGLRDMLPASSLSLLVTAGAVASCALVLVASVFLLIQVIRQQGRILLRLEAIEARMPTQTPEVEEPAPLGLPVGSPAPAFTLNRLEGGEASLEQWLRLAKPILLFFTHPGCGPCNSLLPDISAWCRQSAETLSMVLVSEGSEADNRTRNLGTAGPPVLIQREREVADAYQAHGTPAVVLVQTDGSIGSPLAMGAEPVREVVGRIIRSHTGEERRGRISRPAAGTRGEIDPVVQLTDTSGQKVTLPSVLGTWPAALLFWNPGCGFCQQMLPALQRWEAHTPPAAPRVVVISTGSVDENRAMSLQAPVLADPDSRVSALFGAHGTPMAVLLDANGCAASIVAAGQQAVLALLASDVTSLPHQPSLA